MKQFSFSTNFCTAKPFNLNCIIHFYKPKKGLSTINLRKGLVPFFPIKILMTEILVAIRQIIKILPGNLPRVNQYTTLPSVNNVTNKLNKIY